MADIRKLIEQIVEQKLKLQSVVCKVKSVNENNKTCELEAVNGGADFHEVRLKSIIEETDSDIIVLPKDGSIVICSIIENNENAAFVSSVSEFTKILISIKGKFKGELNDKGELFFNEGTKGGLVNIMDLKLQWDLTLSLLKAAIATGFGALAGLDSSASLNAFNAAAAGIQPLNLQTLEDKKIKH